jgi:hypothetical protein
VDKNSYLLQASKISSQKKDSPMNLPVAKIAVMPVRITVASPLHAEKCFLLFALPAAKKHKCRLSQEKTDLFIAANAFQNKDNFKKYDFYNTPFGAYFFVFKCINQGQRMTSPVFCAIIF